MDKDIYHILLILICIYLWGKWIVFIILSPLIILYEKKSGKIKKSKNISHDEVFTHVSNRNSFFKFISRYLRGYIRYMDIEVGMLPSHFIRNFIYKKIFLVKMKSKSIIYYGSEIRSHSKLNIGEGSIIGDKAILDARNGIRIGKNVNISSNVSIWTEQHDHRDPWFRCLSDDTFGVKICDRAWIGPGVTILHSVTIGEGAVIAAGSIVTKDVPPYTIVAGIPSKIIGNRNKQLYYEFEGKPLPFL